VSVIEVEPDVKEDVEVRIANVPTVQSDGRRKANRGRTRIAAESGKNYG